MPAIQTAVLWRTHPWRPGLRLSWPHLRELGGDVASVLGERPLLAVEIVVPRVVVGAAGAAPAGHFTTARKILDLMIDLLVKPVTQVAMPSFASAAADTARLQTVLTVGTQLAALLVFPGHVGLILVAPDLVPLIFGAAWTPVVPVLQVMALSGHALRFVMVTNALMHGTGHTTAQLGVTVRATAVFVLLLLAMPQTSLVPVALADVLRSAVLLPVRLWTVRRVTGIDPLPSLRGALPLALATGLMAASVLAVQHTSDGLVGPLAAVLRDVALGGLVYVAARLDALTEPGGIVVSAAVRDQLAGKLDLELVDLGEQRLKNIERPVRARRVGGPDTAAPAASVAASELPLHRRAAVRRHGR